MTDNGRAEYVYIVGRGHSGSTLLELLLARHPQIAAMGELERLSLQFARTQLPYPGLCSCGERPGDCPVWSEVAKAIQREFGVAMDRHPFGFRVSNIGYEEDRGLRAPRHWLLHHNYQFWRLVGYSRTPLLQHGAFLALHHYRWARNRFFVADAFRGVVGASCVVDSSKGPLHMRDLYAVRPDGMRVVFITRHPRGSVWSALKGRARDAAAAARHWVKINQRCLALVKALPPGRWMHLRYEDLCADPERVCRDLCAFLGYDYNPRMLELSNGNYHTIGGNRIRMGAIGAIREDVSWKANLSDEQVRQIDEIARPTALELGYA